MEVIKERTPVKETFYQINFFPLETGEICAGYYCNEEGEIQKDKNSPQAYENYFKDLENPNLGHSVRHYTRRYYENAIGKCSCGEEVELYDQYMGACECPKCKRWYNTFGQELNPPETWKDGDDW